MWVAVEVVVAGCTLIFGMVMFEAVRTLLSTGGTWRRPLCQGGWASAALAAPLQAFTGQLYQWLSGCGADHHPLVGLVAPTYLCAGSTADPVFECLNTGKFAPACHAVALSVRVHRP